MKQNPVSKKYLADEAITIERNVLNESGGWQDQVAAAFGGFNKITFSADGYEVTSLNVTLERKQELNDKLLMFFTGYVRYSSHVQESTQKVAADKKSYLREMMKLVIDAESILKDPKSQLSDFGKLLDYTWQLKRSLSNAISTDSIDAIYKTAKEHGALGGKLLGAGGGGFFLFYVEDDYRESVKLALRDLLLVPFRFEDEGTKVIFRS